MAPTTRAIVSYTTITILGSFLAYAAYFDYKRRNDAAFRKKLRKEKKRVTKAAMADEPSMETSSAGDLRAALELIKTEPVPTSVEEKERYFMEQVSMGEQLCARGPAFELPAALSFYRALRVYPSPVELIVIYQRTVPANVFKMVVEMTNMDVKERAEGYYNVFPPPSMQISVTQVPINDAKVEGRTVKKNVLVAAKDFEAGEKIYTENPVVAALDLDLEGKGTHCSQCLRKLTEPSIFRITNDPLDSVYCSQDCQVRANSEHHNLLFGLVPPLPVEEPPKPAEFAARREVQSTFAKYLKECGSVTPLLVARFIARMVDEETAKMLPPELASPQQPSNLPEPIGENAGEYTFYDHIERLRFLEVQPGPAEEEEITLVKDTLRTAMAGLEEFIKEERYVIMKGKVMYNAIGVCFGEGRDDKSESDKRPEDFQRTRTPFGTSHQTGTGFYRVSSYLAHSCEPNVRPEFPNGTSELHLIATRPIKKDEELTMAFVDVPPGSPVVQGSSGIVGVDTGSGLAEARRTRRQELARGWRFACECPRCVAEGVVIATIPPTPPTPPAEAEVELKAEAETHAADADTSVNEEAKAIVEETTADEKTEDEVLILEEPKVEDVVSRFENRPTEDVQTTEAEAEH